MKITKSKLREIIREEIQSLNEVGVGRDYILYAAVDKKIKELEADQREMLKKFKSEKDPKRKSKILQQMRDGTKVLKQKRLNLIDLNNKFLMNLDTGIDTPYFD